MMNSRASTPGTIGLREGASRFPKTDWERVRAAAVEGAASRAALAGLLEAYWYPVYAFIRRSEWKKSADDALDLAQQFWATRIAEEDLGRADPQKGRFRSWLIGVLKNFLHKQRRYEQAEMRNPEKLVWMDGLDAEQRYGLEPQDEVDPERLFNHAYAIEVLRRAYRRAEEEYAARHGVQWLERARELLNPGEEERTQREVAEAWNLEPQQVSDKMSLFRRTYHRAIFKELEARVGAENVSSEIEFLIGALRSCNP